LPTRKLGWTDAGVIAAGYGIFNRPTEDGVCREGENAALAEAHCGARGRGWINRIKLSRRGGCGKEG
jgi:hypothetical protein